MSKVQIDASTPFGNLSVGAVAKLISANADIQRVQAAISASGSSTNLEGNTLGFGVKSGSGADFASAFGSLATALATLMSSESGQIETLDNGNVS